jgi:predicted transposase YdaD
LSYDNACKYLAEQYPQAFVRWLLKKDPQSLQILKTELVDEPIRADALLWLKIGEMILHLEFQTNPQSYPPLPLRMLDYYVHLKRQHQCQVEQVVIFLKKTTSPTAFVDEYRDENTYHKYNIK